MITNEERELARHALVEILAARYPAALPVKGIARRVNTELGFELTEQELTALLEFLGEKGLVRWTWDELGSSRWYAATAAGVQSVERKGQPN